MRQFQDMFHAPTSSIGQFVALKVSFSEIVMFILFSQTLFIQNVVFIEKLNGRKLF